MLIGGRCIAAASWRLCTVPPRARLGQFQNPLAVALQRQAQRIYRRTVAAEVLLIWKAERARAIIEMLMGAGATDEASHLLQAVARDQERLAVHQLAHTYLTRLAHKTVHAHGAPAIVTLVDALQKRGTALHHHLCHAVKFPAEAPEIRHRQGSG